MIRYSTLSNKISEELDCPSLTIAQLVKDLLQHVDCMTLISRKKKLNC